MLRLPNEDGYQYSFGPLLSGASRGDAALNVVLHKLERPVHHVELVPRDRLRRGRGRTSMSTTSSRPRVDPVTASVIRHGLDAAADQMLVTLRRTAFSPIFYDMLDGAGAFYDRHFRMLSQIQCL